jgi:FAD:protein FMN transferase
MRPELHFLAMGTTCSLFGDGDLVAGERWVRQLAARITRFDETSELSRLNSSCGQWVDISEDLEQLLHASLRAFEVSGGLVNVAVLPSMLAIGYTRPLVEGPTPAALDRVNSAPPLPDVLQLARGRARLQQDAGVDLGGIAKGWMADRLCKILGGHVLVNLGGDLFARGEWPVDVGGKTYVLRNLGAATSSTRKRRWGDLHHVIDPRSGLPAASGVEEVSVVADSALDAEVLAKTMLIAGRQVAA